MITRLPASNILGMLVFILKNDMEKNNLNQRRTIRISDQQALMLNQLIQKIDSSLSQSQMIRILLDVAHNRLMVADANVGKL